ncbi:MAG TPA: glycosyltransferase, partial [Chthonomonadales bacterium]|nr:glycosyltransferase [Chthonomonadales bacterium]
GYPDLEYIVIDGGSTDESVEIIRKYEPWLAYWVSEKDRGQSHAINKGLERCTGVFFNWINSDDLLLEGALATVALNSEGADCVVGWNVVRRAGSQDRLVKPGGYTWSAFVCRNEQFVYEQPSTWMLACRLRSCGGLRSDYHYMFDYEMMVRFLYPQAKVTHVALPLSLFRIYETSKTGSQRVRFREELYDIWGGFLHDDRYAAFHTTICRRRRKLMHWIRRTRRKREWEAFLASRRLFGPIPAAKVLALALLDPTIRLRRSAGTLSYMLRCLRLTRRTGR